MLNRLRSKGFFSLAVLAAIAIGLAASRGTADPVRPVMGSAQALASDAWPAYVHHRLNGKLFISDFTNAGADNVDAGSGSTVTFTLPAPASSSDDLVFDLEWIEWRTGREYQASFHIPMSKFNLIPVTPIAGGADFPPTLQFRIFTGHNGFYQVWAPTAAWANHVRMQESTARRGGEAYGGVQFELIKKGCGSASSGLFDSLDGSMRMNNVLEWYPVGDTAAARRLVDEESDLPCPKGSTNG